MPARRRNYRSGLKVREKRNFKRKGSVYVLAFLLIIIFALVYFRARRVWDGNSKLPVVVNNTDGSSSVIVLDPTSSEITTINIPGNTQVEVARNLGKWRLSSVWRLGKDEKVGGRLLANTITKNFQFPILAWADSDMQQVVSGNLISAVKGILTPFSTNLTTLDKARIALFAIQVGNQKRDTIDLTKTNLLKSTVFIDGVVGYKYTGLTSQSIVSNFAEPMFYKNTQKVLILDETGDVNGSVDDLVQSIEVLGAKVASILKKQKTDTDCIVSARTKEIAYRVARYFGCKVTDSQPEGAFDIEMALGAKFAKRF